MVLALGASLAPVACGPADAAEGSQEDATVPESRSEEHAHKPGAHEPGALKPGEWMVGIETPGGRLVFDMAVAHTPQGVKATVSVGGESWSFSQVRREGDQVVFDAPYYDAHLTATLADDGYSLTDGIWYRRRGVDKFHRMPTRGVHREHPAVAGAGTAATQALVERGGRAPYEAVDAATAEAWSGRWAVDFESEEKPSVGIFDVAADGTATGTFLTVPGDYRFLGGGLRDGGRTLELMGFDASHVFLFRVVKAEDGRLSGDFWSGDHWHEGFTATKDPHVRMADALDQTRWTGEASLEALAFPDLDGNPRSLDDPEFAGRARILQLFGSSCPNCHDASLYLADLHRRYGDRGLSILGLAFEVTGDVERDIEMVRRYADRHGVEYPLLLAGLYNKTKALEALPLLDKIRSFPTTIFLHGDGRVRGVYTGFAGPATGVEYDALRTTFESIIEELLAEQPVEPANG